MLPEMTPAVARAIEMAKMKAVAWDRGEVRPEDLIGGLLSEMEGRAAELLARAGADVESCRDIFMFFPCMPCIRAGDTDIEVPLALDQSCLTVLDRAAELAAEWTAEHTVSSDTLLVAMLRHWPDIRQKLESWGLQWDRFESQLPTAIKPPIELDEPLALAETTERIDLARIVDANANRAREALRVVEDYCRFALDDRFLSQETKGLRHELAEVLTGFPSNLLLEARDTQRDVGTGITSASEQRRHSVQAVVRANLKRLQEALRSLEEHGKIVAPRVGANLERLRYRTYSLERCVLLGTDARERLAEAKLYVLLTGALCTASLDWTIQEAAAGGARMFQLREKELDDRALLERARNVRKWTTKAGALLIVNDRPDIARLVDADGVHLGQEDLPVHEARRILGPDKLIGVSTHDIQQLRQAIRDGVGYVGVGPAFPSETKEFMELAGLDFVRQAAAETSLPAFVLGGLNANTVGAAVAAGARRVAVSQAVCKADDPRAAAAILLQALNIS